MTNPATKHERSQMPDMSPEIQDTRSKAAYYQNAHQHSQQNITAHKSPQSTILIYQFSIFNDTFNHTYSFILFYSQLHIFSSI